MWLFMVVACLLQQSANTEELIRKRHLNPQGFMNISEIIDYWRYPSEWYEVLTEDGYYLQVNRIPYGVRSSGKKGNRPAVLLVPGILAEGRCLIANLPSNSIAFVLADAGYDVWILNCRGTTWSRRNQYLSINQEKFWNFSFHEMGIYDVPATINFILQKTEKDALYYVGHSQGASIGLIAFSVMPQLGHKVKVFINLAPGYTLVDMKGLFAMLMKIPEKEGKAIWGNKEYVLLSNRTKANSAKICSYPVLDQLCLQTIFLAAGFNEKNLNVSRVDVYDAIVPDFTSVKTTMHWQQVFESKQFKYFDYGSRNMEVYNKTTPPFYKIEDIIVPTAVWYGGNDFLSSKKDVELLLPRIPRLVFQKYIPSWDHADFIWGLDAPERLFHDMLFLMQQYK
ncbi:putative lysosomal acid lipase/cholesteryl ester hydrolase [Tiliqua scincoides]|uniref:putative lysosomal acid lipase/cholesteryl ester hydrolase n=1 Tax=Tiliqua scincoides TaxID=71010 RepID=UPI0034622D50